MVFASAVGDFSLLGACASILGALTPCLPLLTLADFILFGHPSDERTSENLVFVEVTKFTPREEAIDLAGALALAFHLNAGWLVFEIYTRRGFVDLLPAASGATDELLGEIGVSNFELNHSHTKCLTFLLGDHVAIMNVIAAHCNMRELGDAMSEAAVNS